MILQSPLKKLPRTEGGPGHEHGNSGGPGSSGRLIFTLLAEDEPNTHTHYLLLLRMSRT